MKLKCIESYYTDWGLFTTGKEYKVIRLSPNKLAAEVRSDEGEVTTVIFNTSIYGKFELEGDE